MERRALGRTGRSVAVVGFGAWALGGDRWRGVAADDARDALAAAIEGGCDLIDTALVYGEGEGERAVGRVVRELGVADRVVVASKVPPADRRWPAAADAPLEAVFPVDHVVRSIDASLGNLGLEVLPLAQLHVWRDEWLDQPAWPALASTMAALVRAGKVRWWGVSLNDHEPDGGLRAVAEPIVSTVQVIYNVFDPTAARALLPRAAAHGVGVLARCPFDEGALAGAIEATTRWAPDDFRARYFRDDRPVEVAARVAALRPLLGGEAATLAELALRFALAPPAVSCVLAGSRRAAHVRANLAAADGRRLSDGLLARLAAHAWAKDFYAGSHG